MEFKLKLANKVSGEWPSTISFVIDEESNKESLKYFSRDISKVYANLFPQGIPVSATKYHAPSITIKAPTYNGTYNILLKVGETSNGPFMLNMVTLTFIVSGGKDPSTLVILPSSSQQPRDYTSERDSVQGHTVTAVNLNLMKNYAKKVDEDDTITEDLKTLLKIVREYGYPNKDKNKEIMMRDENYESLQKTLDALAEAKKNGQL